VVLTLFVFTLLVERDVDRVSPDPAVEVNVTGFQWQWRFDYPQHGVSVVGGPDEDPTLVLPAGQTVRVNLVARDVIHSFYIPEFLFKRDTIPGRTNRFDLLIPSPGRYRGACAEFCGVDHAAMNFWVEAVTAERFEAWLEERATG
jgi:cytochrome c oxidase subunit 2